MKNKLFFLAIALFSFLSVDAQINGTSGIIKASTKAGLDAVTPNPAQGEAIYGVVQGVGQSSEAYVWDIPTSSWVRVNFVFNAKDSTEIHLHWSNDTLRASIAQQGATVGQKLRWDGTGWKPATETASEVALVDATSDWSSTDLEALAAEIKDSIDAITATTVTDQANGLDIFSTLDDITVAIDLNELTSGTTESGDQLLFYDASAGDHKKVDVKTFIPQGTYDSDALAAAGGVAIGEPYFLGDNNVYGGTPSTPRYRKF